MKAILTQCVLPYWLDVAYRLKTDYGWEICYIIGEHFEEEVKNMFPESIFHSIKYILKNKIPSDSKVFQTAKLDKTILMDMAPYEIIFLKMMDRMDWDKKFTYTKRIQYYHSQLMYWKGVIDRFRPDIVLFRTIPHRGYDYLLYALCRMLKIKTIMFERTSIPGLLYPVGSFEDGSEKIRNVYREKLMNQQSTLPELKLDTQVHLNKLSQNHEQAIPFHLNFKLQNLDRSFFTIVKLIVKDFIKGILKFKNDPEYIRKSFYKNIGQFRKRPLIIHYSKIARNPDLSKPFIFVALQCEPERQTCPSGGIFGHQYLMIDLLSKCKPKDWKIYVKEHVSQFKSYQNAERARTTGFYDMIASMPSVEFVPLTYTSFELIDRAKAAATVSGTVAWESVVRGKPAMLFGYAWYQGCEGIFSIRTVSDCETAINKIVEGYRVVKEKVELFAKVIEDNSFKGYLDKVYREAQLVTYDENVENFKTAIIKFVNESNGPRFL